MSHQYFCVYQGRPDLFDTIYQQGYEEAAEMFLDILLSEHKLPNGLTHTILVQHNGFVWKTTCVQEVATIHRYQEAETMPMLESGEDLRDRAKEAE